MKQKEMTGSEIYKLFEDHNKFLGITTKGQDAKPLKAYIVMKDEFFREDMRPLPEEERTYEFTSDNKAFISGQIGYSVFAFCQKDNDCMRIECIDDGYVESYYMDEDDLIKMRREAENDVRDLAARKKVINGMIDDLIAARYKVDDELGKSTLRLEDIDKIIGGGAA